MKRSYLVPAAAAVFSSVLALAACSDGPDAGVADENAKDARLHNGEGHDHESDSNQTSGGSSAQSTVTTTETTTEVAPAAESQAAGAQ